MERQSNNTESPFPVDMYQIPGHSEITTKDTERYMRDKKQDESIREIVESLTSISNIKDAPENERVSLIKQALENTNIEVQKEGARMINCVPENERVLLRKIVSQIIQQALENPNIEVQKEGARMIDCVPENEKKELFNIL